MNDPKLPIILFRGDNSLCFGILEQFSKNLKESLEKADEEVIYLDPEKDDLTFLYGKHCKAIIGFLDTVFYRYYSDSGENLFDSVKGPKLNFWFDHPAFYHNHVKRAPKDFHILTHDRTYVNFINDHYRNIKAYFFPPGGEKNEELIPFEERKYDLSFVGTYADWMKATGGFDLADEGTRTVVERYLEILVNNPDYTAEKTYQLVLEEFGMDRDEARFVEGLSNFLPLSTLGASRLFRQEIIQQIIDAQITIDVFGDGWEKSPFEDSPCLRIHPKVAFGDSREIYRDSKMSLNIMSWHKDSLTERVLDIMLSGSIALSDYTDAIAEEFIPGKEIALFSLKEIHKIPNIITNYQQDETIAKAGYLKASRKYTWDDRAIELLNLIDNISQNAERR